MRITTEEAIVHLKYMLEYDARDPYYTALEMGISALEKQTPKKPYDNCCPICKTYVSTDEYCRCCGQHLSYGNDLEKEIEELED